MDIFLDPAVRYRDGQVEFRARHPNNAIPHEGLAKALGDIWGHLSVHQDCHCQLARSGTSLTPGEFGFQPRSPDTNPLNLELQGIRGKSSRGPDMGVRIRMSIPF